MLVQRVKSGRVIVEERQVAAIDRGLVILMGIGRKDTEVQAQFLANKIASLRIFEDTVGKFNLSILDVKGAAIVVSQFTLYGDTSKGRRPSFTQAAQPDIAAPLIEKFVHCLRSQGISVQTGIFGEHMLVEIENDGPVTFWLEK